MTPEELIDAAKALMAGKSADYTTNSRHENFERCASVSEWFRNDLDKTYVTFIMVKIARLASLLDRKEPNNESIEDTFKDLVNYAALWGSRRIIPKVTDIWNNEPNTSASHSTLPNAKPNIWLPTPGCNCVACADARGPR